MGTAGLQGDLWGARARAWADLQEGAFRPLYTAAFDAAGLSGGATLLDVGCGAGLALATARARGASGSGLDAAAPLVAIARERLPNADIRVGELEALPFDDGGFDVVTGFNSFQYAADRVHALTEARRVTRRGGRIVAAIWGEPEHCQMDSYIAALGRLGPPPPAGAPGTWALSPPGALEALVQQAGLTPGVADSMNIVFPFADEDRAVEGLLAAGPAVRALRHAGEPAVRAAVAEAIRPYRRPDGGYVLENRFRYLVASA